MDQSVNGVAGRRVLGTLALALAALLGVVPGVHAGQIYVLTSSGTTGGSRAVDFGTVDTTTGAYTQIAANVGGGQTVRNLAWDPTLEKFYTAVNTAGSTTLRTIGTDGVLSNALGVIGKTVYGMAYQESSSTLFGYDYEADKYGTINPANGGWTQLTSSPGLSSDISLGGRFAFHTGTLYAAVNNGGAGQFGTFGTTAGSTFAKIVTNNPIFANMVLASDGTTLYGVYGTGDPGSPQLFTIDPGTGALTAGPGISGAGLSNRFLGAGVVPAAAVPEPATLASAALGALAALGIARRRRQARQVTA